MNEVHVFVNDDIPKREDAEALVADLQERGIRITKPTIRHYTFEYAERKAKETDDAQRHF